jgi:hypothetical protein
MYERSPSRWFRAAKRGSGPKCRPHTLAMILIERSGHSSALATTPRRELA